MTTKKPQVALLIDADNISPKLASASIKQAKLYGDVIIRFACGTEEKLKGWEKPIEQYRFTTEKAHKGDNVADMMIAREALNLVIDSPEIDVFCVVANDKHFVIHSQLIKLGKKRVIPIGTEDSGKSIKELPEFVELKPEKKSSQKPKTIQQQKPSKLKKIDDFIKLLKKAFAHAKQEWLDLARLGNILKVVDTTFKAKDYGNAKLKKLLKKMSAFVEFSADEKQVKLKV